MRVVAGTARGRPLIAPTGTDTRPTGDRVREATFNALGSLGALDGAHVVDLFAGSGALGIEALSRGAARCTFVDWSRPAAEAVTANLERTGLAERAEVVRADVMRWLATEPVDEPSAVDLVVADPPYAFDGWESLLARLADREVPLVVIETDRELDVPAGWSTVRQKRYGTTVVLIVRRALPSASAGAEQPHPPE